MAQALWICVAILSLMAMLIVWLEWSGRQELTHKHKWIITSRGYGQFPKNNVPERRVLPGHMARCEDPKCTVRMFFPINLGAVEVFDD